MHFIPSLYLVVYLVVFSSKFTNGICLHFLMFVSLSSEKVAT